MTEPLPTFDLYATLKVAPDAPTDVIVAAHRVLVRREHPDLHADPGAAEHTQRLNVARDWLTDPARRAFYDRCRTTGMGQDLSAARTPPDRGRSVDLSWERSPHRAELEIFLARCAHLTATEVAHLTAIYLQVGGPGSRLERTGDQLVRLAGDLGRQRVAIHAANDAITAAQISERRVGAPPIDLLRWTAFALAVADAAPLEAGIVLAPWRDVIEAADDAARTKRSSWPHATHAARVTGIVIAGAGVALAGAGLVWLVSQIFGR